jgi:hypothetical protein
MHEWSEKLQKEAKRQREAEEYEIRRMKERKIRLEELHQYEVECQSVWEETVEAAGYMS